MKFAAKFADKTFLENWPACIVPIRFTEQVKADF